MPELRSSPAAFPITRWSLVDRAVSADCGEAALETFCRDYWLPLYAFARRSGRSVEEAEDLTQGFFQSLLEKRWLAAADRDKGKLRTFLLTAFRNYMANQWRREQAEKRGGGHELLSLENGEHVYASAPSEAPPDELFDRQWAVLLLNRTLDGLRAEFEAADRAGEFAVLREALIGENAAIDYAAMAGRLSAREGAVRVAVHRLRKKFRERFRAEVARTLPDDADIDDEMHHLALALARGR